MRVITAIHGEQILIDDEDFDLVSAYRWHISSKGYATCSVKLPNGKYGVQRMHRMVLGLKYGDARQGDHRDPTRKLDNRRANLRISTPSQNQTNRTKFGYGTNPLKGITRSRSGKWIGQIRKDGKHYHLGTFDTPEEAHDAYRKAADVLHGEFANYG